jgi:hypothetical protein
MMSLNDCGAEETTKILHDGLSRLNLETRVLYVPALSDEREDWKASIVNIKC